MGSLLKRFVLIVVLLSAVLVAAALAFVDSAPVKDFVTARISDAIGRRLTIAGDVALDWSLTPHLEVTQVSLANGAWSDSPHMVEIGRLGVQIDLLALARGQAVLPRLEVEDYRLLLERSAGGVPNWQFVADEKRGEPASPPVIRSLQMRRGAVVYRNRQAGINRRVTLDSLHGAIRGAKRGLELEGSGSMEGEPLRVVAMMEFRTGDNGRSARRPLELDAALGEASAHLKGRARNPLAFSGLEAEVSLHAGAPLVLLSQGPAGRLNARLMREGDIWQLNSIHARWGESELNGRMKFQTGGQRPLIEAKLAAPQIDLTPFLRGRSETTADRAWAQIELPRAALRSIDADIRMTNELLHAPGVTLRDLTMDLSLDAGHLSVTPLEATLAGGEVNASLDMHADTTPTQTTLTLRVDELDLRKLLSMLDIAVEGFGTVEGQLELSGTGESPGDWLAGTDGRLAIVMQRGRLDELLLQLLTEDITGVLDALAGGALAVNRIRCLIADAVVQNGVMELQRLLIDTPNTKIIGDGVIHLAKHTLDLKLLPRDKDFSLISGQAPIHISGSFTDPVIELDESAMAGSLLTPIELGLSENADCHELARAARRKL